MFLYCSEELRRRGCVKCEQTTQPQRRTERVFRAFRRTLLFTFDARRVHGIATYDIVRSKKELLRLPQRHRRAWPSSALEPLTVSVRPRNGLVSLSPAPAPSSRLWRRGIDPSENREDGAFDPAVKSSFTRTPKPALGGGCLLESRRKGLARAIWQVACRHGARVRDPSSADRVLGQIFAAFRWRGFPFAIIYRERSVRPFEARSRVLPGRADAALARRSDPYSKRFTACLVFPGQ